MSKNNARTVEQMEIKRRELDRQIRAAKRAESKAAKEALLAARQELGVWLTKSVGADDAEAVQTLRATLESGQIQALLRERISAESSDTTRPVEVSAQSPDHVEGGDCDDDDH
ncbi:hypothetical protein [Leekyejoonella antrihumi]|uniref:Uncharacterized protein n=1 Tax=Leekyejoonella antrihumi TaxID=1660198 RepID=A0A563DUB9_9MICO|nr:hypothetical protein [Leekyejoonella antrihumi]TWP33541.1 hypothetical protein FGL98_21070 [Leekyejoonella antrihumi]